MCKTEIKSNENNNRMKRFLEMFNGLHENKVFKTKIYCYHMFFSIIRMTITTFVIIIIIIIITILLLLLVLFV